MQNIEQSPGYVDSQYLDNASLFFRIVKQRSYELMQIREGHTVLDLGCGAGIDTFSLASRVGPSGYVVGVDRDPLMIREADSRAQRAGLSGCVGHELGEAYALVYPNCHFDACRTERMLMHVDDPPRVVAELHRVLKPGGWLVICEPDWATLSIASGDVDVERRLARIHAEQVLVSGYVGRQLYPWMRQIGFQELKVEITPLWDHDLARVRRIIPLDKVEAFSLATGLISQEELDAWRSDLLRLDEQGCFFGNVNIITVAGRKADGS